MSQPSIDDVMGETFLQVSAMMFRRTASRSIVRTILARLFAVASARPSSHRSKRFINISSSNGPEPHLAMLELVLRNFAFRSTLCSANAARPTCQEFRLQSGEIHVWHLTTDDSTMAIGSDTQIENVVGLAASGDPSARELLLLHPNDRLTRTDGPRTDGPRILDRIPRTD